MSPASKKKTAAHAKKAAPKRTAKKAPARAGTTAKTRPAKKKPAPGKTAKKRTTTKAATKPSAARHAKKTSAAKAPKKESAAKTAKKNPAKDRAKPRRRSRSKAPQIPAADILPRRAPITAIEGSDKLGKKWDCYSCGAKFYDLNKAEPLCPKCGASQHDAPRVKPGRKTRPSVARKTSSRGRMSPLLDDEDDSSYVRNQDVDLRLANANDDEEFVETPPDPVTEEEEEAEEP